MVLLNRTKLSLASKESEKLRHEAEELQALARRLMEQAEKLIITSKELEKKIDRHSKTPANKAVGPNPNSDFVKSSINKLLS